VRVGPMELVLRPTTHRACSSRIATRHMTVGPGPLASARFFSTSPRLGVLAIRNLDGSASYVDRAKSSLGNSVAFQDLLAFIIRGLITTDSNVTLPFPEFFQNLFKLFTITIFLGSFLLFEMSFLLTGTFGGFLPKVWICLDVLAQYKADWSTTCSIARTVDCRCSAKRPITPRSNASSRNRMRGNRCESSPIP
jgi:hypothetical protein